MEYLIFPMKYINISQGENGTTSHTGLLANDLVGSGEGKDAAYAPATCKVIAYDLSTNSNTVFFGTCDSLGNEAAVKCADGQMRVLTFAMTHDDNIDDLIVAYNNGTVFAGGTKIYDEGEKGQVTGPHIHMEVAEGWVKKKQTINGRWQLPGIISIKNLFYKLSGWNVMKTVPSGYNFATASTREPAFITAGVKGKGVILQTRKTGIIMRNFPISGSTVSMLSSGVNLEVVAFYAKMSDGYQWAKVRYLGKEGYVQLNTYNTLVFGGATAGMSIRPESSVLKFYNQPSNGNLAGQISIGSRANITAYMGLNSNGYQCFKILYNGITGYAQFDSRYTTVLI